MQATRTGRLLTAPLASSERRWNVIAAAAATVLAVAYALAAYAVSPVAPLAALVPVGALGLAFARPAWGLCLAAVALPLELVTVGVGSGALSLSESLFAAIGVGWLWRAAVEPSAVAKPRLRDVPIIVILAVTALGATVAPERAFVVRITVLWVLFYFVYLQAQTLTPAEMRRVLAAFAIGAGILGLIGSINYLGGTNTTLYEGGLETGSRATGTFVDANYYAALLVLAIPPALALGFADLRRYGWLLPLAAAGSLGVAFSLSRGALVGLAMGLLLLLRTKRIRRVAFGAVVVLVALALTGATPVVNNAQFQQVEERLGTLTSGALIRTNRRPEIWRLAVNVAIDHPILGVGARNFESVSAANGLFERGKPLENVHNQWLSFAAENGVIALFAFTVLTLQWLVASFTAIRLRDHLDKALAFGLLATLVAFLFQSINQAPLRLNVIAASFFLVGGMIVALADRARQSRASLLALRPLASRSSSRS